MTTKTDKNEGQTQGEKNSTWEDIKAKLDAKGNNQNYVTFETGKPTVVTFIEDEPTISTFEGKDRNGSIREVTSYHFKVEADNQEKILSIASSNLMRQLIAIRSVVSTLKGATLSITKSGSGLKTEYTAILISKP
jgi:hypothetical protein